MSLGPVELLVVKFPGNQFRGEIVPALEELIQAGIVRIIDIIFVYRDAAGDLTVLELNDLDDADFAVFDPLVADIADMFSSDDIERLAAAVEPNSSGLLMLFENTWATRFRDAVVNANGEVVINERIPRQVIDELLAATVDA